jgi:hypothetical protein
MPGKRKQSRPRQLGMPERPQGGGGAFRGDPMNGMGQAYPGLPAGGAGGNPQKFHQGQFGGQPQINRGHGLGSPNSRSKMHGAGGAPQPGGFDYDAFNAWQDTTQSDMGAGAGQLQEGWGGFGALGSQMGTKMNNYLNQFQTGGERENVMNQIGYFNGGNAFDPASVRGSGLNQAYRQQAQQGTQQGSFTAAGNYQAMTPYAAGGDPWTSGGYIGNTSVPVAGGPATYTPMAPMGGGGGGAGKRRRTRTFGDVMQ